MANSLALTEDHECGACGNRAPHPVWLIIDTLERPDLEQLVREDRLREGTCPVCGAPVELVSEFLLLYRPNRDPVLILAIPPGDEPQASKLGSALLSELRTSLGDSWRDEWVTEVVAVSWDVLAQGYQEAEADPVARLEEMAAELSEDLDPESRLAARWHLANLGFQAAEARFPRARAFAIEQYELILSDGSVSAEHAAVHNNLARLYIELPSADTAADMEAAVAHARSAIAASSLGQMNHTIALGNLGSSLTHRIGGDRALDLDEAVEALTSACAELGAAGQIEDQARFGLVLANALADRINGNRAENLDRAVQVLRTAADTLLRIRSAFAAPALLALGNAYSERAAGHRADNLRDALAAYDTGIALKDVEPSILVMLYQNAGNAHRDLARLGSGSIVPAIEHYQNALSLSGSGMPETLAATQENLAIALALRDDDGDFERATTMLGTAAEGYRRTNSTRNMRRTLRELGELFFNAGRWAAAVDAFGRAAAIDVPLFTGAESPAGRRAEIAATGRMHGSLAYALARLGRPEEALGAFEGGRTRMLRMAVSRHRDTADRGNEAPKDGAGSAGIDDPKMAVPPDGALVAIVTSLHGGLAIVLPSGASALGEEHVVWLDQLDNDTLQAMLLSRFLLVDADGSDTDTATDDAVSAALQRDLLDWSMTELINRLWVTTMAPIEQRLSALNVPGNGPITLMPSGGLGLLPLHVATGLGEAEPQQADGRPITIAPSALAVRKDGDAPARDGAIVVVGDPTGDLPFASIEAKLVAARWSDGGGSRVLVRDAATPAALLRQIVTSVPSHLHLACHGRYGWDDPFASALDLAGGSLSLADVEQVLANARISLVMLSACESGVTELGNTAEEYLGWPLAFLQSGVTTVISTMWPISDVAAAMLVDIFYREYRRDQSAARALHHAQTWLREATPEILREWAADVTPVLEQGALTQVHRLLDDVSGLDRPFEDPRYWAAFFVSGGSA